MEVMEVIAEVCLEQLFPADHGAGMLQHMGRARSPAGRPAGGRRPGMTALDPPQKAPVTSASTALGISLSGVDPELADGARRVAGSFRCRQPGVALQEAVSAVTNPRGALAQR
jgi:hypothetical protein